MYHGDRSRKDVLVNYGFRLPSARDNRPLTFEEFENRVNQVIYVSATPGPYELTKSAGVVVEQIIRPTGLTDPEIEIRPIKGQVDDLLHEIRVRAEKKRTSAGDDAHQTNVGGSVGILQRSRGASAPTCTRKSARLIGLRFCATFGAATYDVLIGVNLLREGLDLPEVSLVAILDADKEGFLALYGLPYSDDRPGRAKSERQSDPVCGCDDR